LAQDQRKSLIDLLYEYKSNFAKDFTDMTGTNLVECEIHLSDERPFRIRPYRLTPPAQVIMDKVCDQMENAGIIKQSNSPYSSPCLLVMKNKLGSKTDASNYRLVNDSRYLNEATLPIFVPLITVDEVFETVSNQGGCYFSKCDLKSSFHQLKIKEEHKKYTAFTTGSGHHFEYERLAMGLKNSGFYMLLALNKLFGADINKKLIVYIDDLLWISQSFDGFMENTRYIMDKLRHGDLKLHPEKCMFARPSVEFLSFHLSSEGSKPSESKVKVIKEYKQPKSQKDVRAFLGLCGYFRRYIENYSQITASLRELTKKDYEFKWTDDCVKAFVKIKEILTNPP